MFNRSRVRAIHSFFPPLSVNTIQSNHDAEEFVLSALFEKNKNEVARLLCTDVGVGNLKALLQAHYISQRGGTNPERYSYENVAIPLCYLLSNEDFVHSKPQYLRQVYLEVARHPNFIRNYVLIAEKGVEFSQVQTTIARFSPENEYDVWIPIVDLGYYILSRLGNFEERDEIVSCMQETRQLISDVLEDDLVDHMWRERLRDSSCRLQTSLCPPLQLADGNADVHDHSEFRTLQALPAEAEILGPAPKLRQSEELPIHESNVSKDDVSSHLEYHCGLLREDMNKCFRMAARHFIRDVSSQERPTQFRFSEDGSDGSCLVFWNVNVEEMTATWYNNVFFRLSFDQLFRHSRNYERDTAWNSGPGQYILQQLSPICIVFDVPEDPEDPVESLVSPNQNASPASSRGSKLVMALVNLGGRDELHENMSECTSLLVLPVSSDDRDELIRRIAPSNGESRKLRKAAMLQVRGHYITNFEPVIRSLQAADWTEMSLAKRIFMRVPQPTFSKESNSRSIFKNPAYISSATTFDLRFLMRNDLLPEACSEATSVLQSVQIWNPDNLIDLLKTVTQSIILDHGQIEAFAYGISQQTALIHGPPGCGKQFIAVQIAKTLLANRSGLRHSAWTLDHRRRIIRHGKEDGDLTICPILCICVTNHALDQLLESMVSMEAVKIEDVLRLGLQSKSEIIRPRTMRAVMRGTPFEFEYQQHRKKKKGDCSILQKRIEKENERIKDPMQGDLWHWIKENDLNMANKIREDYSFGRRNVDVFVEMNFRRITRFYIDEPETWLEQEERKARFEAIIELYKKCVRDRLKKLHEQFSKEYQELQEIFNVHKLRVMRNAKVIGCTTSGAAIHIELLKILAPTVIICEEAAKSPEAHILSALTSRTEQIVLIGDHLQLRPKVRENILTREAGNGHDLDISMFERLVEAGTVPVARLKVQHRMHPEISKLLRLSLYPFIVDADIVRAYPKTLRGLKTPLFFFDHNHTENMPIEQGYGKNSRRNSFEAEFIVALARYIIQQGYTPNQVAILTPYLAQVVLIKEEMMLNRVPAAINESTQQEIDTVTELVTDSEREEFDESAWMSHLMLNECVTLSTVDTFDVHEADVVLLSTVHCNNSGDIGDLRIDNRVNVMVSRARHGMIILGSADTIEHATGGKVFKEILEHLKKNSLIGPAVPLCCEQHGNVTLASVPEDIPENGGCGTVCGL